MESLVVRPLDQVATGDYIALNLDHKRIGCGIRNFVVVSIGTLWVRLLLVARLTAIDLPRDRLDRDGVSVFTNVDPDRLAGRLADTLAHRRRARLRSSGVDALTVIAALKQRARMARRAA